MTTVGCGAAEGLLWVYIRVLGDASKAHVEYVDAIRSGPLNAIAAASRNLEEALDRVRDARQRFQKHRQEHGCCDTGAATS